MARRTQRSSVRKTTVKNPEVKMVEELIAFGLQGLEESGVVHEYNRGIRYWKGDHKIRSNPTSKGNKVFNKFAEIIEVRLSHLTDARPKWLFRPQGQEDIEITQALNQIMGDVIWDYINWDKGEDGGGKAEDSMLQASFAGSGHIKTVLDVHNGHPNFIVIPVGSIIPDPKAKSKRQLRYWIHLVPTSVSHIKRQYGVDVAPQVDLENLRNQNRADFHSPQITAQLDTTNDLFPSTPFKIDHKGGSSVFTDPSGMGMAIVAECWKEDHSLEAIPSDETDTDAEHNAFRSGQIVEVVSKDHHPKHIKAHETFLNSLDEIVEADTILAVSEHIKTHNQFPQESSRRKYPFGRVITISQGKLLKDRKNPFSKIGLDFKDVLIKYDYYKNPESYWGKPLTHDLFDSQDELNHRKNSITQNINLLNSGTKKVKWALYEALKLKDNPKRLNNMPGNVYPFLNNPDEITTDYGAPFPSQIWGDINWTVNFMESQALHQDVAAGRLPAAGTANSTLETLLGEFKTILRKPLRHYAGALAEMGRNAVLIMAEYMDAEERFLILGEDQKTFQEIRWGDIKDKAALIRNVRIDTTNLLPTSRMETFRKVIEMMQAGVPPEAAIQLLDDPKAIQIMQTMSQINQLRQALEQMGNENKQLKEQLNTLVNRMQGQSGLGNVGIFQTEE